MRSRAAPRATSDCLASVPVTSAPAAPRTTGGTTTPLTTRRHPDRGPSSWLSTTSTYGTLLRRHHVIAAWELKVLQPETTTTSGRARPRAAAIPGVTGGGGVERWFRP